MGRKDFKKHNDAFTCLRCGEGNPASEKSERNHCRKCLFSLHVDEQTPGDRGSSCLGEMPPISIDYKGKKGFMIKNRCEKCGKEMLNRAAEDDDLSKF